MGSLQRLTSCSLVLLFSQIAEVRIAMSLDLLDCLLENLIKTFPNSHPSPLCPEQSSSGLGQAVSSQPKNRRPQEPRVLGRVVERPREARAEAPEALQPLGGPPGGLSGQGPRSPHSQLPGLPRELAFQQQGQCLLLIQGIVSRFQKDHSFSFCTQKGLSAPNITRGLKVSSQNIPQTTALG